VTAVSKTDADPLKGYLRCDSPAPGSNAQAPKIDASLALRCCNQKRPQGPHTECPQVGPPVRASACNHPAATRARRCEATTIFRVLNPGAPDGGGCHCGWRRVQNPEPRTMASTTSGPLRVPQHGCLLRHLAASTSARCQGPRSPRNLACNVPSAVGAAHHKVCAWKATHRPRARFLATLQAFTPKPHSQGLCS